MAFNRPLNTTNIKKNKTRVLSRHKSSRRVENEEEEECECEWKLKNELILLLILIIVVELRLKM